MFQWAQTHAVTFQSEVSLLHTSKNWDNNSEYDVATFVLYLANTSNVSCLRQEPAYEILIQWNVKAPAQKEHKKLVFN